MPNVVLFEDEHYIGFLPLTYWRTVFELRLGRKIQLDRIAQRLASPVAGVWTRDWMVAVATNRCGAPVNQPADAATVLVNGRWVFHEPVEFGSAACVGRAGDGIAYVVCDAPLATKLDPAVMLDPQRRGEALAGVPKRRAPGRLVQYPWEVIDALPELLTGDWHPSDAVIEAELDPRVDLGDPSQVHVGERTAIHPTAVVDSSGGPVFISHDVTVGAMAIIEGPAYIGPGSRIHPHARLHGGVAIGPVCKLGGELDRCLIHGYANKQHEGFLGHAYIGAWVNMGAGATNSDLKNTYGSVRVPICGVEVDTGTSFFGTIIGDHVKIGINATLPTGAVLGFAACVATNRIPPKFVPSFGWFTDEGLHEGDAARLLDIATAVMARRQIDMTDEEIELFLELPQRTAALENVRPVPR